MMLDVCLDASIDNMNWESFGGATECIQQVMRFPVAFTKAAE
jgi:hypothetical protein